MEKSEKKVRVRFAPSPTGHLHIGGLRTALFNLLFARRFQGKFLLRIEDTDSQRSLEQYTQEIISSLEWSDIIADEPVIIQSKRFDQHQELIQKLLTNGSAYRCYCIANLQASCETYFKYDGACRVEDLYKGTKPFVVRIKLPLEKKTIVFYDLIRGKIEFDINQFDDFIIARSDGTPTYNFVVVADDVAMGITHVIRGEDHIPNTPKQIVVYEALKHPLPEFAHIPLILGSSGQKLSKRDAAVAVVDYKKKGYLPQALCNYLVRLGWAHQDQEIFSRQELINLFTLEGVNKKGSIFDLDKLNWVNSLYIQEKTAQELLMYSNRDVQPDWQLAFNRDKNVLYQVIDNYKKRVSTLRELIDEVTLVFKGPDSYNKDDIKKHVTPETIKYIHKLVEHFENLKDFSAHSLEAAVKKLSQELGVSLPSLAQPIRIALIGKTAGPGIFSLLSLLGKDTVLERLSTLKDVLRSS